MITLREYTVKNEYVTKTRIKNKSNFLVDRLRTKILNVSGLGL